MQCCLEPLEHIAQVFDLFNVVQRVLGTHCTGRFLVKSCLESLREHRIDILTCSMLSLEY